MRTVRSLEITTVLNVSQRDGCKDQLWTPRTIFKQKETADRPAKVKDDRLQYLLTTESLNVAVKEHLCISVVNNRNES